MSEQRSVRDHADAQEATINGRSGRSRFRIRLSGGAWVLLYTGVYVALLGVASAIDVFRHSSDPSLFGAAVEFVAALFFMVPFSIIPFAGVLVVLYLLRHLRPWQFRLAAMALCCVPSILTPEPAMLKFYLPVQILVALMLLQPHSTADEDPVGPPL